MNLVKQNMLGDEGIRLNLNEENVCPFKGFSD